MLRHLVRLLIVSVMSAVILLPILQHAAAQPAPDSLDASHQDPLRGVVWDAPAYLPRAEEDLRRMRQAGVEAIRTSVIRDRDLLSFIDTLGLSLFVDLPISRVPGTRLNDTLGYAIAVLDSVLGLARSHPSIRRIGLARYIDSSDSTSCTYLRDLAERVRDHGEAGMQVYYLTRFIKSDRCADTVNFVLADVTDLSDPVAPLRSWRWAAGDRPIPLGVGSVGKRVRSDTLSGLRVPWSPEAQGRYFEQYLPILLSDTLAVAPPAVFVFRWRDVQVNRLATLIDLEDPYVQQYGLLTRENIERPAAEVVEGIYTGRQETFAFRVGRARSDSAPLTTFFGWAVIVLLATFYALSPRFRHMAPRYFSARFFYRDAVREGRDVLFGASTVLLITLGAAFGLTLTVVLDVLRETEPFLVAVGWLPKTFQDVAVTLLEDSWVLIVLAGCIYAVGIILWTFVLSLLSKRAYLISTGQALMLVVWPRWPLFLVMMASMVLAYSTDASTSAVLALAASWLVVSVVAAVRTVVDYVLVTRVPVPFALLALALNSGVVGTILMLIAVLPYRPEMRYLWHLASRS